MGKLQPVEQRHRRLAQWGDEVLPVRLFSTGRCAGSQRNRVAEDQPGKAITAALAATVQVQANAGHAAVTAVAYTAAATASSTATAGLASGVVAAYGPVATVAMLAGLATAKVWMGGMKKKL